VDLRVLGIPVRADLPGVGSNLADHPGADVELAWDGPLRAAPMLHAVATLHARATPDAEPPDLMLWLSDPPALPATIDVVLLRPRARGRVRIRSADPSAPPRIRLPDAVGDPSDLERLVEGTERAIELANHPSVRAVSGGRGPVAPTGGRDDLRRRVTANAYSVPHVVGTCAMGPAPEAGGVVDHLGRVHGTDGLLVADASIIPLPPSGFTHLPTIMVAERIGEWLVADLSRTGRMMGRQPREEPR